MKKSQSQNFAYMVGLIGVAFIVTAYTNPSYIVKRLFNTQHNADEVMQEKNHFRLKKQFPNNGPDLEIIRKRIIDDLLAPDINVKDIKGLAGSIRQDGTWPGINYVDTSRTGFQHSRHLENMLNMSRAFKKPGSALYQNPELKKAISSSLDFWIKNDFICENWWWNEMGTPNMMINILLIMDIDLTNKQRTEGARIANRANLEASGARPGGDLIQIAGMLGRQGLFARNEDVLQKVVNVMGEEIKVTTGRGLKPDLSFHHRIDNVISIHTYGTGYASAFAYWAVKTAGTKFTLPEASLKLLIDYYLDGICKAMAYGRYPDIGAKNRDLTRKAALSPASAELAENLMKASAYRRKELEEIVQIRKGDINPASKSNRFFWHSEYFMHQRPQYFSSVRMHSSRNHNMEQPHNEEGLKNHHFADGSNFITINGNEYFNIFPVWDWQKIPGTTVVQKPDFPHWRELAKKGLTDFVGAVSDGEFGASAFDFASPHDPLKARKSWFFFDKEYVCLGAAINADTDYPVATTLNQCLLKSDVVVKTDNTRSTPGNGDHTLNNVSWVFHNGVGYLFPSPAKLRLKNSTAIGNWRQINHQAWATADTVKEEVFTLWIDHGARPVNKKYEYIVVPGTALSVLERYSKDDISILTNTPDIQAVQHKRLNISQVVFYKAGQIKLSNEILLIADKPCLVMVTINDNSVEKITVADPTHKLQTLQLKISSGFESSESNWRSNWSSQDKSTIIDIDLPREGDAGKSVVLKPGGKKA